ncbi:hypothetical protein QCA50_006599 [Cerrena zonata]|uniref:Protein kinase domain-containing protein n=1 Tax=Cerrena zonata TaxID=2478898 RepID=A0AAW0GFD9_9APHY
MCTTHRPHLEKDGDLSSKDIPPLVVKICTSRKYYKTGWEAYNYEEMETLQGSVIPRYYGHFMAVVEPGNSVKVWTIEKRRRQELDHEIPHSEVYESDDEDHIDYPRVVTILLLERYTPNPLQLPPKLVHTIREDAMLMFAEIAAVGIQHNDIHMHLNNVVQANETYLPTLSSPKYNKKFQWRIIDFGLAQKSEHTYKELMFLYEEKSEEPRWNP